MFNENEVVTMVLATGVAIFILVYIRSLSRLPFWGLLLASFLAMYAGWILTVVEGFLFPRALNVIEHSCYMLSSILIAVWCLRFLRSGQSGQL